MLRIAPLPLTARPSMKLPAATTAFCTLLVDHGMESGRTSAGAAPCGRVTPIRPAGAGVTPSQATQLGFTPSRAAQIASRPKVAILREQGVNGQSEMAYAFHAAGFESVDVHMTDVIEGRVKLNDFVGLAACGGFSYGDVLGAGQGWGFTIKSQPVQVTAP